MEYISSISHDDVRLYVQLRDLKGHSASCEKAKEIDKLRACDGKWALAKLDKEIVGRRE